MSTRFRTVPVDATAVLRGHIIPVAGLIATVTGKPDIRNGNVIIRWAQVDCGINDEPLIGILPVPDGATVDCIRNADWLAGGEAR